MSAACKNLNISYIPPVFSVVRLFSLPIVEPSRGSFRHTTPLQLVLQPSQANQAISSQQLYRICWISSSDIVVSIRKNRKFPTIPGCIRKIPSPSRRPYAPEASIPLSKRGKKSECSGLLRNYKKPLNFFTIPISPSLRIPFLSGSVHVPVLPVCPGKNRHVMLDRPEIGIMLQGNRRSS